MILTTTDPSGAKKFYAGFYCDNSICWTTHEVVALDKSLDELKMIAETSGLEAYNIRERISISPVFCIPNKR